MADLTFPLLSTFLALPLEDEAKEQYQALQKGLEPFEDIVRFQNPRSPHLTLQFWKEVMEIEFNQIVAQAEKIASKTDPFVLQVTGIGLFENRGDARVLFLDCAFSEPLARLKKSCPWPSDKPFAGHITLARIRHPQKFAVKKKEIMKKLAGVEFEIPVDRMLLYAEVDGVKQTVIGDFVFEGN